MAMRDRVRANHLEFKPNDALHHRLCHSFLKTRLTDIDSLTKVGGERLVQDIKELPAYTNTLGFPGFEVSGWPATVGQLYTTTLTKVGDDTLPFVYGLDDKAVERIERSLVPLFQQSLTDPLFQEDTIAIQEFLALLQERRIPPLVVIGGLGVLTGGDLGQLDNDQLPTMLRDRFKNVASDIRTTPITLSEYERNETHLREWIGSLRTLHTDLKT